MNCEDCEKLELYIGLQAEEGFRYCWLCIRAYKLQWEEECKNRSVWTKLFTEPFHEAQEDFFRQLKLKAPESCNPLGTSEDYWIPSRPSVDTIDEWTKDLSEWPGVKQLIDAHPNILARVTKSQAHAQTEIHLHNTITNEMRVIILPWLQVKYINSTYILSLDIYENISKAMREMTENGRRSRK